MAAAQSARKPYREYAQVEWSAGELAVLGTMTDGALAEKMGISNGAVRFKRLELGIASHRRWTSGERPGDDMGIVPWMNHGRLIDSPQWLPNWACLPTGRPLAPTPTVHADGGLSTGIGRSSTARVPPYVLPRPMASTVMVSPLVAPHAARPSCPSATRHLGRYGRSRPRGSGTGPDPARARAGAPQASDLV